MKPGGPWGQVFLEGDTVGPELGAHVEELIEDHVGHGDDHARRTFAKNKGECQQTRETDVDEGVPNPLEFAAVEEGAEEDEDGVAFDSGTPCGPEAVGIHVALEGEAETHAHDKHEERCDGIGVGEAEGWVVAEIAMVFEGFGNGGEFTEVINEDHAEDCVPAKLIDGLDSLCFVLCAVGGGSHWILSWFDMISCEYSIADCHCCSSCIPSLKCYGVFMFP